MLLFHYGIINTHLSLTHDNQRNISRYLLTTEIEIRKNGNVSEKLSVKKVLRFRITGFRSKSVFAVDTRRYITSLNKI